MSMTSDLLIAPGKYCDSLTEYTRFKTREVDIGGVPLGGGQSHSRAVDDHDRHNGHRRHGGPSHSHDPRRV